MTDDRKGGAALIAGAVLGLLTMSLHPSGRDLLATGQFSPTAFLAGLAHAIAIASMPLSFLGALALSRRLAAPDRLAVAALVVYGFALAAGLAAATLSGFVAPGLARQLIDASPPATDHWRVLFQYNGLLNQAFARVLVVASATAIVFGEAHPSRSARLPTPNAFARRNTPAHGEQGSIDTYTFVRICTPWPYLKMLRLRFFSKRCPIRHGCVC